MLVISYQPTWPTMEHYLVLDGINCSFVVPSLLIKQVGTSDMGCIPHALTLHHPHF